MSASEQARAMGASVDRAINWTWSVWPADNEDGQRLATDFAQWCQAHGYETRGVYPPHREQGYAVRFR